MERFTFLHISVIALVQDGYCPQLTDLGQKLSGQDPTICSLPLLAIFEITLHTIVQQDIDQ